MLVGVQQQVWSVIGRARYHFLDRHYTQTVRVVLVAACLALTAVTSTMIVNGSTMGPMVVVGVAGLCFFIALYRNLELGLVALAIVSLCFNLGLGSGTGTPIMFSMLIVLASIFVWLFKLLLAERSFQSVSRIAPNWPIMLFIAVVPISIIWSIAYVEDIVAALMADKILPRIMTGLTIIISPATALLIGNNLRSDKAFRFIVWWVIGIGGLFALMRIGSIDMPEFFNDGGQFAAWVVVLAFGQALFNDRLSLVLRGASLGVAGLWLYVAMGQGITWLSGWVPICVGIAVVLFFRAPRLFVVFVALVAVFLLANLSDFSALIEAENEESGSTRLSASQGVMGHFDRHFLFGMGPTGYHFYMEAYEAKAGVYFANRQRSHNNYVDILAQTGIVGFSLWIWMWAAIGWVTFRAYRVVPRGSFWQGLAAALMANYFISLLAMMLGDWVTPFTYTQTLAGISYTIWHWIMVGMAIALYLKWRPGQGSALNSPSVVGG